MFQTVVKRGIAMEQATDALIDLIKEHGRWVDPPTEEEEQDGADRKKEPNQPHFNFIDKEKELLNKTEKALSKKFNFTIVNHFIRFYGLCNKCKKRG